MSLFLSQDEQSILKNLEQVRPEGLHEHSGLVPLVAIEALIERRFVVKSDGGFLYCTVNGLKYLQDQSSLHIGNTTTYLPLSPSLKDRFFKFFGRMFSK